MSYKRFTVKQTRWQIDGTNSWESMQIAEGEYIGNTSIKVIELAALEACQKRLDEAVIILKKADGFIIHDADCSIYGVSYRDEINECDCGVQKIRTEVDTFLAQIKDEGE